MEDLSFATPANITGMGSPTLPTENECGSGDICICNKKKMKSLKDYIKDKVKSKFQV